MDFPTKCLNFHKTDFQENSINFAYMATFSTSHTCHMWRISDFSTSVMQRHLKFLHMWRNFQFPHNCHTWKAEICPHDNFSPLIILVILVTNIRSEGRIFQRFLKTFFSRSESFSRPQFHSRNSHHKREGKTFLRICKTLFCIKRKCCS